LDLARRSYAADLFVAGHAEQTFVDLLNQLQAAAPSNKYTTTTSSTTPRIPAFVQGRRIDNSDLDLLYDQPLTLPTQSTLGRTYGRCTFCTYPAVEPVPTELDLETAVGSVIEQAILRSNGTSMSIKDSLVTPLRLVQIASCVQQQQ
jgi:radical SAM superfamily enzyme YgiQ (UPF0313 family)